jgi:hypothetical protein
MLDHTNPRLTSLGITSISSICDLGSFFYPLALEEVAP